MNERTMTVDDASERSTEEDVLLSVEELSTHYVTDDADVQAVEDVSFELDYGETIGLVGESGCGKTTVGLSLIRSLPPQGKIVDGHIRFNGADIAQFGKKEMKKLQWKEIAMIYQGAMNAFNPVKTIGYQIREVLTKHEIVPKGQRREHVKQLLERVNLDPNVSDRYPHELSGGMKQRAAIAMAISCEPSLLIADEPTTGIDVVVQARVMEMLRELQNEFGFGMIFISHDMATVMNVCDRIGVMYAGNLAEYASASELYHNQQHPYTAMLLDSVIDPKSPPESIKSIDGTPPDLSNPPSGCRFAPRCPLETEECHEIPPQLESVPVESGDDHRVACYHIDEVSEL